MTVSDLVGEIEGVRSRTRRATRGGAVPLALLGLLVAASVPVYAAADTYDSPGSRSMTPDMVLMRPPSFLERLLLAHPNSRGDRGIGIFWLIAVPVAFVAVAAYYAWRARRTGLSLNGWRVAAVGTALYAALVALMYYAGGPMTIDFYESGLQPIDVLNPFLVVALSVFVLAWVERSVTVLLAALHFAGFLLLADIHAFGRPSGDPWYRIASWGWATVILSAVLLLWAGIVALVRRPRT